MFNHDTRERLLNWRSAIAFAVISATVGVFSLMNAGQISACSCIDSSQSLAFSNAGAVFMGRVVAIRALESLREDFDQIHELEVQVDLVWKGPRYETMFLQTRADGVSCGGLSRFKSDLDYIVYAHEKQDLLRVGLCSRIIPAPDWQEELDALGQGMVPEPGTVAESWKPPAAPTPSATPTSSPKPSSTPSPTATPTAIGGNCNILASSAHVDIVALPLGLVAGIAWIGIRQSRRQR